MTASTNYHPVVEAAPPAPVSSEHCRNWKHDRCATPSCACGCHEAAALFATAEAFGVEHDVPAPDVRELVAHLRSRIDLDLGLPRAVIVAQLVIDLGWRPAPQREGATA